MANRICVGAQWGDEGKGKIIDVLTENADVVVRSQGGNNAGHTVLVGDQTHILHLVPSGILHKGKVCVIGNGVVIDPISLMKEIQELKAAKITINRRNFLISDSAHIVFPFHRTIDILREKNKGKNKIGTTKRGIGPAYGDKVERVGLRMIDLIRPEVFEKKLKLRLREINILLKSLGEKPYSLKKILGEYQDAAVQLKPFVTNTVVYLHNALKEGKEILFEGAQGTFLDLDHGTYPYVTSSNTTAGGACTGSGVPPHRMDRVIGVMKAYTTRVGEGPFPTENKEFSKYLHGMGREFGATTGRARRCGWFDAVATNYAAKINGIDEIAITNLDGLDEIETLRICVGYKQGRKKLDTPPADVEDLAQCEPVYMELPGWQTSTSHIREYKDLPVNARKYLEEIAKISEATLKIVSVGPHRDETIFV